MSCSSSEFSAAPSGGTGGDSDAGNTSSAGRTTGSHLGGASAAQAGASSTSGSRGSADGGVAGEAEGGQGGVPDTTGFGGSAGEAGASGEAGACSETPWFPDGDGDHFGRTTAQVLACSAPSAGTWVKRDGDCNDDDPSVFPKEKEFKAAGFPASSGVSFDYDCSGQEEADPSQIGAAPACASLGALNCSGTGFAPTGRTGPGVNPLCGSKTLVKCSTSGLSCVATTSEVSVGVRCR